jgi:hypothetical protein
MSMARRAAWSLGAIVLLSTVGVSCTTGGGGGCGMATQVTGGYPLTAPAPGWYSADTRATGNVTVNNTYGAPMGFGCFSARMTTGDTYPAHTPPYTSGQDKAQLFSYAKFGNAFAPINNVSYWSYRAAEPGPAADIALNIELHGTAGFTPGVTIGCNATPCFTSLVFEPYLQSGGQGAIVDHTWQHWDAVNGGNGVWWSSRIPSGDPGSQGNPQPWSFFKALYSDATLGGYGFNIGSSNPNMDVAGDGLTLGSTTTNF